MWAGFDRPNAKAASPVCMRCASVVLLTWIRVQNVSRGMTGILRPNAVSANLTRTSIVLRERRRKRTTQRMGDRPMAQESSLAELVAEIRKAAADMCDGDAKTNARIDALAKSLDTVLVRLNRPGPEFSANDNEIELRKDAHDYCCVRHAVQVPKDDGRVTYEPSPAEIDEAIMARKALSHLWRVGDPNRLEQLERKSLSSFSVGTSQYFLPPSLQSQVLS